MAELSQEQAVAFFRKEVKRHDSAEARTCPCDPCEAARALIAAHEERGRENVRLKEERRALLSVKTKEGLLASEWLMRTAQAKAKLADAHCLLQEAAAAVDPETWPELSAKLAAALECGLPQCKHAQEAFEARDKAEAREAKLRERAQGACPNPCGCGSGKWPCHVDGDAAFELVLTLAASPEPAPHRPSVVCLCGSTRFMDAFHEAGWRETLAGKIVLTVGVAKHMATEDGGHVGEALGTSICARLDELHKRKIDLADEVLVLNVGGYVGDSTRSEIEYARAHAKPIRWLEEPAPPEEKP